MNDISISVFLQNPDQSIKRMKLLHILGAVVLLLMGTAFLFYPAMLLKLIGLIAMMTGLLVLYYCLPSKSYELARNNKSLRTIEIACFVFLGIGFLVSLRYVNFAFMLAMAAAYGAMLYVEMQTSSQRFLHFTDKGLEFTSIQKHFFFDDEEIKKVNIDDKKIAIKFADDKFLEFILAQKVPQTTITQLQNRYS